MSIEQLSINQAPQTKFANLPGVLAAMGYRLH